ncbi:MAG TPA: DUF4430 domain-containing protein [Solirubrobacterales bacterium]|jgi:hypothetical protein|nr:DUF4430 domain-containing protein [Solirubrobacterales bacterium]
MRKSLAAFSVATLLFLLAVPAAQAVTQVNVRIEGASETIFEGPISVEAHGVKASSDTSEGLRRCDGINVNDPGNVTPAPTPTAASANAMASIGESFDGQWYEGYDDYFITRWGPQAQDPSASAYWGLLVNEVFTNVGGCQYQLDGGDEVLWVCDAFNGRPSLALFPVDANYASGPRPLTATAELGKPFGVEVVSYADDEEAVPSASPSRSGSAAYAGAEVAPVLTDARGFEKADMASPRTVTTDSQGRASVVFTEPGWHRIKATRVSGGKETVIRSNRLDVCVKAADGGGCGNAAPAASTPAPLQTRVRVGGPRLNRKGLAQGKVGVSWKVIDPGVGVRRWRVSSQEVGRRGARYVSRTSGRRGTSATVHLPGGAGYRLRLTIVDALGRSSDLALGRVTVPRAGRG